MRVLFVAEDWPFPPNSGGRLRTFNLLRHLSLRHDITLVAPAESDADVDLASCSNIRCVIPVPPLRQNKLRMMVSPLSPLPYFVRKYRSPAMKAAVEHAVATGRYDLLHCDSTKVASSIPVAASLPKVLNAHNVEAMIWQRYMDEERRPWMIPLLRSQLAKVAAYESQLPRLFDWCATVSEQDRQEMRLRYGFENVQVVPNGVDLGFYSPLPDPLSPSLAFVGSFDYRPNKDAVRWFIGSIWPRIQAEVPEAAMTLVGRRPPPWLANACVRAGILLYADVPDVRPYLADAAVIVAAIRIGSGTRLKILEAMAAGRCVVSTTVGAEGLDVCHGEQCLIADDPADFASAVTSLLRDPLRRQTLSKAGRALVEAKYGWDRVALQMEEAWDQACAQVRLQRQ